MSWDIHCFLSSCNDVCCFFPLRIYLLGISALSDDPDYGDSPCDQGLRLCTPDEDPTHPPGSASLLETLSASHPRDPQPSGGKTRPRPRKAFSAKPIPEDVELKLSSVNTSSISVNWDFLRSGIVRV